jgi:hypothetical protein
MRPAPLPRPQIKYESFLQDVHNILTSGEVPNLFPRDELGTLLDELRPASKAAGAGETAEELYTFFLERVRANLHVVLCLSPIGDAFRERCRMFPGLINCSTIDWFTEWPADALYEVGGWVGGWAGGQGLGGPPGLGFGGFGGPGGLGFRPEALDKGCAVPDGMEVCVCVWGGVDPPPWRDLRILRR